MFSTKVKSAILGIVVVAAFSVTAAAVNGVLPFTTKGDVNSMSSSNTSSIVSAASEVSAVSVDSNIVSSSTPSVTPSSEPSNTASSDLGYTSNGDKIVSHYDNGKVEITQTQPKPQKAPTITP